MSSLNPDTITITTPSDLKVVIVEKSSTNQENEPQPHETRTMNVDRATLIDGCQYFKSMLTSHRWAESDSVKITLQDDHIVAMEILLRKLHGTLDAMSVKEVSVADVWHLVLACDKYGLNPKDFQAWFASWAEHAETQIKKLYDGDELKYYRQILFPSWATGHAALFAEATMSLVYGSEEHIVERNPTKVHQMHLPPRMLREANERRPRPPPHIAHKGLFDWIATILRSPTPSPCCERTVFEFFRELQRISVWPFEDCMRHSSIDDLVFRMRLFNAREMRAYTDPRTQKPVDCSRCGHDWKAVVAGAAKRVEGYFDGLCLDCMDHTKNLEKGGDRDRDYWAYMLPRDRYDVGCRIKHGEPTWYFSFMGRREKKGLIADV
ncbi:hypothetical protein ASPACDRAFT_46419 [Aspergillus aculeatus ATCC 16872]|uniref:BTB domain-containing protein n=1 Tax=Aspergillus aculeatus (strain ATCC 16872 / CBS 172.66 / WB 5094) TaxID=690307 RepID=A0A1L9WL69_ASPA1|nr:uncharacterized protein ASPACDRAFT_46419 [Aspergillus aculeatus ATCC 16872]OJJ96891.1 hypothetical protein ASPACDRAFT_46419 [Aspergillus aculeatus ATCC 16872]